jgi:hypothetical protein
VRRTSPTLGRPFMMSVRAGRWTGSTGYNIGGRS